jgi:hypothetical protein
MLPLSNGTAVITVAGTAGQVTVTISGRTATLSLPAALTGINSVTAATNTALTLATLDNNKNIVLSAHGTGVVTTANPFSCTNTTQATSTTAASVVLSGGLGVAKNVFVGGDMTISGSSQSLFMSGTGAIQASTFCIWGGGAASSPSSTNFNILMNNQGALVLGAGSGQTVRMQIANDGNTALSVSGTALNAGASLVATFNNTTEASNSTTAAVVLSGGLAVAKKIITASSIQTGTPNGGTAGAWKLGIRVAATVALDTTQYIQLDVGGTLYKVGLVS